MIGGTGGTFRSRLRRMKLYSDWVLVATLRSVCEHFASTCAMAGTTVATETNTWGRYTCTHELDLFHVYLRLGQWRIFHMHEDPPLQRLPRNRKRGTQGCPKSSTRDR